MVVWHLVYEACIPAPEHMEDAPQGGPPASPPGGRQAPHLPPGPQPAVVHHLSTHTTIQRWRQKLMQDLKEVQRKLKWRD